MAKKKKTEFDLNIYDVWQSVNGNLFIKLTHEYSIAIGQKGHHDPNDEWGDFTKSQFVKANNVHEAKKVGEIKWQRKKK